MDLQILSEKLSNEDKILTTSRLYELGISQRQITGLVEKEFLVRIKSGYYRMYEAKVSPDEIIVRLFPEGILTMESACHVYGYIKREPMEYSVAVNKNTSKSRFNLQYPFVRAYYTDENVLSMGVCEIPFGGRTMKIYSKERLICEVLKFEDRMSRDDVKSTLTSYIKEKDHDLTRLTEYALKRQVKNKVAQRLGDWL